MIFEHLLIQAAYPVIKIGEAKFVLWWWPYIYTFVKNLYILMTILILVATVVLFSRFKTLRTNLYESIEEALESGKFSKDKAQRKWEEIKEFSQSEDDEKIKKAIIAAEETLDSILKAGNFPGENLAKRVEKIPDNQINFKDDIIWAFKFKERMQKEIDFELDKEEARRAFYIFERTLKELNVL